jgi:hypothetical protein
LVIRDYLLAGAFVAAQPVFESQRGLLTDCMAKGRLSVSALAHHALACKGAFGAGGSGGQCSWSWRAADQANNQSMYPTNQPPQSPQSPRPAPGVLLLGDDCLLRFCPKPKLDALLDALRAAARHHGAAAAAPTGAPDAAARWALALHPETLAAAPPHLAALAAAPPVRALAPHESSRRKEGADMPAVVRDAVKAWHVSAALRYAVVVTPDADDVAGDAAARAHVEEAHLAARAQRTVLSGGASEVAELLRVMAGEGGDEGR